MQLNRPGRRPALISIVPMIDVLLILLVFFMVTSSYLNLDLIPAVESADTPPPAAAANSAEVAGTIFIRLGADGSASVAGARQTPEGLAALLGARLAAHPASNVIILPSGRATMQALVSLMDTASAAGATRLRVIRLEAQP